MMVTPLLRAAPMVTGLAQQADDPKVEVCGEPGSQSNLCSTVYEWTNNETAAEVADAFHTPANVVLILLVAFVVNMFLRFLIKRFTKRLASESGTRAISRFRRTTGMSRLDDTGKLPAVRASQRAKAIGSALRSVSTFVVWTVAALLVLGEIGLDLGPLIAGAGVAGVALGFGAQNIVKDFLAGLFIVVEDQIGVGDIVDLGPATGTVEAVTLRMIRIRDVEGVVWFVPNGEIQRVGNMSQEWSRALLDIAVAYDTPVDEASDVIKRVADEVWRDPAWSSRVLAEPEIWGVEQFGADAILIRLVMKTAPLEQWGVKREVRRRLKHAFDEAGIVIPFPQRTVWFRAEDADSESPLAGEVETRETET